MSDNRIKLNAYEHNYETYLKVLEEGKVPLK